jgi:hypothetical protein
MVRLQVFSWDVLERSTLNTRRFLFRLPESLSKAALLFASGNADNPAPLDLCDLTDHRPDSTRGRAPACAVLRQQATLPDQDRKD